jgi:hypothetical protein
MSRRDLYGLTRFISVVGGFSAMGWTYPLLIGGFILLGISAWKKQL